MYIKVVSSQVGRRRKRLATAEGSGPGRKGSDLLIHKNIVLIYVETFVPPIPPKAEYQASCPLRSFFFPLFKR